VVLAVRDFAQLSLPAWRMKPRRALRVTPFARKNPHRGLHPIVAVATERLRVMTRLTFEVAADCLKPVGHLPITRMDTLNLLDSVVALEALTLFVASSALVLVGSSRKLVTVQPLGVAMIVGAEAPLWRE